MYGDNLDILFLFLIINHLEVVKKIKQNISSVLDTLAEIPALPEVGLGDLWGPFQLYSSEILGWLLSVALKSPEERSVCVLIHLCPVLVAEGIYARGC